jgi:hypothetical protein
LKIKLILSITIATLGLYSCSPKVQPSYSAEVNFLNKEATGSITVKSIGYGKNHEAAVIDAQKNAFNVILFKGIPGTDLNIPLVSNESDARARHSTYFNKLLDQGNYKTFMMASNESSNLIKVKGSKKLAVDIKINYNSLRQDLEQNQVTRKFGF